MTTLALYSNKGGVGKTAACVNLAYQSAFSGLRTLICDLDPQSSSTYYFRIKPKLKRRARGLVKGGKPIDQSIKGTDFENLDLLPSDFSHRNLDITFDRLGRSKHRLQFILEPLREEYDLVILDCPPTINILAENVFNAVDKLLVPLIPTPLSLRTYKQLLTFLKQIGFSHKNVYAFFSMVDRRKKLHREMGLAIFTQYDHVLRTPIPYRSHIEQMGIYRQPVSVFAPRTPAAQAYQDLWAEVHAKILNTK